MRTTVTLDEEVAAQLKTEMRRSGASFKQTVNDCLRTGLDTRRNNKPVKKFKVTPLRMGLRPGLSYDSVWELLEHAEGPYWR